MHSWRKLWRICDYGRFDFTPDLYRCGINSVGVVNQQKLLENYTSKSSVFNSWEDEAKLEWGNLSSEEGKNMLMRHPLAFM